MQISDEVGRGGGREGEPGCEASRGWTAGGGTRAASSQLGSTSDDGIRASTLTTPVLVAKGGRLGKESRDGKQQPLLTTRI
ncbi:hypothetical protein K443DRAFT_521897 [Laccaria amethystina LaAM-08-1]|uniref:Uncharacterized protein n=1 Tax=Laccaria amethystina LaAM-08-1 TaxID=1095629 RepID=A0A0C9WH88_9AGAR|nr:hypothetical protein K443DRAFT_521897 [Laccaria amethystina LaAM-08-1]